MGLLRSLAPELFQIGGSRMGLASTGVVSLSGPGSRSHIETVLAECGGDRSEAARRLGVSRTTLWRKLKGP